MANYRPFKCTFDATKPLIVSDVKVPESASDMNEKLWGPRIGEDSWDSTLGTKNWHIPMNNSWYLGKMDHSRGWYNANNASLYFDDGKLVSETRSYAENVDLIQGDTVIGKDNIVNVSHTFRNGLLKTPTNAWRDVCEDINFLGQSTKFTQQLKKTADTKDSMDKYSNNFNAPQTETYGKGGSGSEITYDDTIEKDSRKMGPIGHDDTVVSPMPLIGIGIRAFPKLPVSLNTFEADEFYEARVTAIVTRTLKVVEPNPQTRWSRVDKPNIPWATSNWLVWERQYNATTRNYITGGAVRDNLIQEPSFGPGISSLSTLVSVSDPPPQKKKRLE